MFFVVVGKERSYHYTNMLGQNIFFRTLHLQKPDLFPLFQCER